MNVITCRPGVPGDVHNPPSIVAVSYPYVPLQNICNSMISSNRETADRRPAHLVSIYDSALCWLV